MIIWSNSLIKIRVELITYFQQNPLMWESLDGLALKLRSNTELIRKELCWLVGQSILIQSAKGDEVRYRYKQPFIKRGGMRGGA